MTNGDVTLGPLEIVGYCQTAQLLGVSQREALRVAREWGLKIRTKDFGTLWRCSDDAMRTFGFAGVERR